MAAKVALYARVSTDNQDLADQIKKLETHADANGYEYDLYDEQVSSIKDRPQFEQIMADLDQYDKIVVTKIDRFARSIRDFTERINQLRDASVEFEAVDQPIDTDDEVYGDFFLKMLALFAELERKMIRRRLEEGFQKAQDEGRVGRPEVLTKQERDQIEALYLQKKYKYETLAEQFDVSKTTIYRTLKERGAIEGDSS
jgi:DNA invertase Pin-like site-specific DNA recombinase